VQFLGFFIAFSVFAYFADPKPLEFSGLKNQIILIYFLGYHYHFMFLPDGCVAVCGESKLVQNFLGKTAQNWIEKGESDVSGTLQNILA